MATARPKQARRAGAAARSRAARPAPRPEKRSATRHRRELAAIACVALAVFLAFVIYFGWDGGALGRGLGGITRWLVGLLVFVLPLLLCFVAYILVAREDRRPPRGVSWGIALIVAAFALAAAADAFGVFAGERPERLFQDTYMSVHGGAAGEALWAALHGVIGRLGVHVLVVALFVAGVLLATGSS
ncbi:MAG: DNA translocase FtsK 4TM domain-containing protein, partial [Actinomycetes bacterium]